jgi:hypothetical protein
MKAIRFTSLLPQPLIGLLFLLAFRHVVSAQTGADLAGTWNNITFSTPARLTLFKGTNGVVYDIFEREEFDARTAQIIVQSDGTLGGDVSGSYTIENPGKVVATVPGETIHFSVNAACDFMFAMKTWARSLTSGLSDDLVLLFKAPASLTMNDLAGTWKIASLGTPGALVLTTNSNNATVGVQGHDGFDLRKGTLTVAADGSFVISGDMSATGTVEVLGNGMVQVDVVPPDPDPPMTLTFFVNDGKNVMAACSRMGTNFLELDIAVKQPDTADIGDFKGLWRQGAYQTPSLLTLIYNLEGEVVDVLHGDDFQIHTSTLTVGYHGDYTVPSEAQVGAAVITGPGKLVATSTNALGETDSRTLWCNTGKDVFLSARNGSQNEIYLATRAPASTNAVSRAASMGMMLMPQTGGLSVCWASDTNLVLQCSTNLVTWDTLTNTVGQGCYPIDPTAATNGFYRVMGIY